MTKSSSKVFEANFCPFKKRKKERKKGMKSKQKAEEKSKTYLKKKRRKLS